MTHDVDHGGRGRERTVDVVTEIEIRRPPSRVAAYVTDQDNAPHWYENLRTVEWQSPPPAAVGSRIAFVAQFLGRRLALAHLKELLERER